MYNNKYKIVGEVMEKAGQMKEILKNYDIVVCDESYKRKLLEFMHTDKIIIKVALKSI